MSFTPGRNTFPESLAEILLLEIFCEEELINVEYISTGTNCQNLFQSAVAVVNKLFQEHGIKPISSGLWPNCIPPYFRTFFDIVNRKKTGKWSDGTKPGEKLLRQLERRREELRVEWSSIPSRQQMREEPSCRKRILSELLNEKDGVSPTPTAINNDAPEEFYLFDGHLSPAVHLKGLLGPVASPIIPPQAPYIPSLYPYSSDILGGISGPSSTMIEKSPQPYPEASLEADDLLGEFVSPLDLLRRPSSFDQHIHPDFDFNALSALFQLGSDPTLSPEDLTQSPWDQDHSSLTNVLSNIHCQEPSVPISQHQSTPSILAPRRGSPAATPIQCSIPTHKRKFDESTSGLSTSAAVDTQYLEPPRRKRKAHRLELLDPMPTQGGFVPVQSHLTYPGVLDRSTSYEHGLPSSDMRFTTHAHPTYHLQVSHPLWRGHVDPTNGSSPYPLPNIHRSQTTNGTYFQDQGAFHGGAPTFQPPTNRSHETSSSLQQNLVPDGSEVYQQSLDVGFFEGGYPGIVALQARASRPLTDGVHDTEVRRQRQKQESIRLAMLTANAVFAFPWCWTNPPWKKMREMAQSEAAWHMWVGTPPHSSAHTGPHFPFPESS